MLNKAANQAKELAGSLWTRPGDSIRWQDLGSEIPPEWGKHLDMLVIEGFRFSEVVLLHKPSRTLICSDLVSNLGNWDKSLLERTAFARAHRRELDRQQLHDFVSRYPDRTKFLDTVHEILDWDFERIVMAHGDVFEGDAKSFLRDRLSEAVGEGAWR